MTIKKKVEWGVSLLEGRRDFENIYSILVIAGKSFSELLMLNATGKLGGHGGASGGINVRSRWTPEWIALPVGTT